MTTTTVKVPTEVQAITYPCTRTAEELKRLLDALKGATAKLTEAMAGEDLDAQRKAVDESTKALESYNEYATQYQYEQFLKTENPMKTALIQGYITLKRINSEDNLGVKTFSAGDVDRQVDFISFNTRCRLLGAKTVQYASQMGYIILVDKGVGDGADIAAITKAYQSARGRVVLDVLEAAPSMKKKKEALQNLLDAIYFEDCGTGKNKFMVTKEWVNWFQDAISRAGYTKGTLFRQSRAPKDILQTACALYHAYFNKYGIRVAADRENFVAGAEYHEETKAE